MRTFIIALLSALLLLSSTSVAEILDKTKAEITEILGKPYRDGGRSMDSVWDVDGRWVSVHFGFEGPVEERKSLSVTYEQYKPSGTVIEEAARNQLMAQYGEYEPVVTDDLGWAMEHYYVSKDRTFVATFSLGKTGRTRTMDFITVKRLGAKTKKLLGL